MMLINLTKQSKVIIFCIPYYATGGTELLHQLGNSLKKRNINVFMYYPNRKSKNDNPVPERLRKYNVDYLDEIEDNKNNFLILPEVYADMYKKYKKSEKIIWWLSVDNYYNAKPKSIIKRSLKDIIGLSYNVDRKDNVILHLAQSKYAYNFLENKGKKKIKYLSDYLNDEFFNNIEYEKERKDIVLYNPVKGFEFTKKIIENCRGMKFIAIENMSPIEVKNLLMTSKVYIDFGNHPGKDRFPREAASCGCCIITGKKGSAKYSEDVYINEKYKFEDIDENIPRIVDRIQDCIVNYELRKKEFEKYRIKIKNEKSVFEREIDDIFKLDY